MNNWADFRIRTSNFFKKNRKKIIIILVIWVIIISIEYYLRTHPKPIVLNAPSTTYTPYVPVMNPTGEEKVPDEYQEPISNLIDEYFNYCNNGEYEKAYNLITEECRTKNYPTLEQFKAYVDKVFEGKKKIYNIQSYSIVDNKYIFNIRILDDILANGTSDGYYYYEEKFVMIEENGTIKLSIAEYIGDEKMSTLVYDDYVKVEVINKSVDYETVTYKLRITNKTKNYVVISDNTAAKEIQLDVNGVARLPINTQLSLFYLPPEAAITQEVQFNKFYDENAKDDAIVLNNVRVLKEYNWSVGTTQENLDEAIKVYSIRIPLE